VRNIFLEEKYTCSIFIPIIHCSKTRRNRRCDSETLSGSDLFVFDSMESSKRNYFIAFVALCVTAALLLLTFRDSSILFTPSQYYQQKQQQQQHVAFRMLDSFDNITSAHSPIKHKDHHHHDSIEYFSALRDTLTNLSRQIYDAHADVLQHTICVGLNIRTYGGLGNLLGTIKGAQALAFVNNRHFILNNPVILSMFDHPDPKQDWHKPAMDESSWARKQRSFSQCGESMDFARTTGGLLGLNRCDQNVCHNPGIIKYCLP
jgi:hypothetical protein